MKNTYRVFPKKYNVFLNSVDPLSCNNYQKYKFLLKFFSEKITKFFDKKNDLRLGLVEYSFIQFLGLLLEIAE